jgi:MFS family permease
MFEPPSGAMIADMTDGERRAEAFGVLRIGGNLGWALGPAIGGFLAALSYASLFYVAAGVLLIAAILIALKVEETSPRHRRRAQGEPASIEEIPAVGPTSPGRGFELSSIGDTLRDRVFLRYCLITFIFFTVMAQLMSTLSVYVVEWTRHTQVELGILYTLNGLMVVFLQFPVVRLLTPFRLTTAMVAGSLLYVVGYGMMGMGSSLALLAVAMFVVTSGEIISSPASMNLVANFSSDQVRGRYMGVYGLFNSFGWSIGPLVGGVLLDVAGGRSLLLWGPIAGLMLLATFGYWDLRRRIDPDTDQNKEGAA